MTWSTCSLYTIRSLFLFTTSQSVVSKASHMHTSNKSPDDSLWKMYGTELQAVVPLALTAKKQHETDHGFTSCRSSVSIQSE